MRALLQALDALARERAPGAVPQGPDLHAAALSVLEIAEALGTNASLVMRGAEPILRFGEDDAVAELPVDPALVPALADAFAALAPDARASLPPGALDPRAEFRVHVDPRGAMFAQRLPDGARGAVRPLASLGFSPDARERLGTALRSLQPLFGKLVLLVGPPGSGRTTTFYAALGVLGPAHVVSVERSILAPLPWVFQRDLSAGTLSGALRSMLRQDPDLIAIDASMGDDDLAMLLVIAETGHGVIATLEASGAADAVRRLRSAAPHQLPAGSLIVEHIAERRRRLVLVDETLPDAASPDLEAWAAERSR